MTRPASLLLAAALTLFAAAPALALFEGTDEEEIGKKTDQEIVKGYGLYEDERVQEYVRGVGRRVLEKVAQPEFEYHFKVVDHEMVNAFALPGGYIYVTRGLLAALNSESALAGVLGHEIGHVIGHHAVKQMKKSIAQTLLALGGLAVSKDARENAAAWLTVTSTISGQILSGYGREMEVESDQVGMILAHDAGYDPEGIVHFLKSLRTFEQLGAQTYHGFMATHPDTISRIIETEGKAGLLAARDGVYNLQRDRYLDAIDGLRYGAPKRKGLTYPPYKLHIHTVEPGDTFRALAEKYSKDATLGLETAALNGMELDAPLAPGLRIKTLVPAETVIREIKMKKKPGEEETTDEIGPGTGDGKKRPADGR
ncbi:MAG: M48 family metalloprotease [Nitrospinae bacterium]|nr:M48 family metalloprotease [Nitrospinota bacterium]